MTGLINTNALASALYGKQVTRIRVSGALFGPFGPDFEHITELAGPGWQKTKAQVVADIRAGFSYYVDNDIGPRALLEVMPPKSLLGDAYVRTRPDCTRANNLLSLPRF